MTVAIIDYGSGNLRSVAKAFERAVAEAGRSDAVVVTDQAEVVRAADRVVLPGVGAFGDCRKGLDAVPGMVEAMGEAVFTRGRPFLGICVGMQLLADRGLEHGSHPGLGWIPGAVVPLAPSDPALKIPHMGWNELEFESGAHPLLTGISPHDHAYFVHSYHFAVADAADRLATVDYGGPITAIVARGTVAGTQFHPEKSQATGLRLITNFLCWTP
ncbi:MAG: imidazole glycerol phosphate synthase subunit HisH [Rhodospirillaceae bacterium]